MPNRYGPAPESAEATREVRQFIFGRYRILYTVEGDLVHVLTVRHGARKFLSADELKRLGLQ